jgi:formate hydrogenlyase subunit 4
VPGVDPAACKVVLFETVALAVAPKPTSVRVAVAESIAVMVTVAVMTVMVVVATVVVSAPARFHLEFHVQISLRQHSINAGGP